MNLILVILPILFATAVIVLAIFAGKGRPPYREYQSPQPLPPRVKEILFNCANDPQFAALDDPQYGRVPDWE